MLPLAVIAGLTRNILTTYRSLLRNITCCFLCLQLALLK